jgi:hypothetical protein
MSKATGEVGEIGDLFTVEEWRKAVEAGLFNSFDGSGAFVVDGEYLTGCVFDDVFGEIPPGVTHIEWYNK